MKLSGGLRETLRLSLVTQNVGRFNMTPIELLNAFRNSANNIRNYDSGEYEWTRDLDADDLNYIADLIEEDIGVVVL
jgi:hypothetical protein